jgi:selT/selW/selH-like putative selenoprotein
MDSKLIRGSGGVFVVMIGNEKIFSKNEEGRFPKESEIIALIRERQ